MPPLRGYRPRRNRHRPMIRSLYPARLNQSGACGARKRGMATFGGGDGRGAGAVRRWHGGLPGPLAREVLGALFTLLLHFRPVENPPSVVCSKFSAFSKRGH